MLAVPSLTVQTETRATTPELRAVNGFALLPSMDDGEQESRDSEGLSQHDRKKKTKGLQLAAKPTGYGGNHPQLAPSPALPDFFFMLQMVSPNYYYYRFAHHLSNPKDASSWLTACKNIMQYHIIKTVTLI